LLHLVGSSILLYLIDDARSNKNQLSFVFLTPEDGTDMLSRNVGNKLPLLAA